MDNEYPNNDRVREYRITEKRDGSWVMQAFNSDDQPISKPILIRTVDQAWKLWMFLNGYAVPLDDDDDTQELGKVA